MKNTKQMRIIYNMPVDQLEIYIRENVNDDWGLYQAYPCRASVEEPDVTSFIHFSSMFAVATLAANGYEVVYK